MSEKLEREQQEAVAEVKVVESMKKAKTAKKDPAKTPANESAVSARAAAVSRSLGSNEGKVKTKAEPDPVSQARGGVIAAKFIARSIQRNN